MGYLKEWVARSRGKLALIGGRGRIVAAKAWQLAKSIPGGPDAC